MSWERANMKNEKALYKALSLLIVTIPLVNAFVAFMQKYALPNAEIPLIIGIDDSEKKLVFYLNFFVPFVICTICLYVSFFVRVTICETSALLSALLPR
jgi:hypothetical protein